MSTRQALPQWQTLIAKAEQAKHQHLADLFAGDAQRFDRMHLRFPGLLLDFSKQRVTEDILTDLVALADACELKRARTAMFAGEVINVTEQRAVKHWALRLPQDKAAAEVAQELERMADIVNRIRAGHWRGATGEAITDVVNIGVGGSDLGPLMTSYALRAFTEPCAHPVRVHFASSMDGSQMDRLKQQLNPSTTLCLISSKSFSTADTLHNANTARHWLLHCLGDEVSVLRCHFVAISARADKMTEWGIPAANQLNLWDWVGGRFSLWSTIGLPIALTLGMKGFHDLLAGAHAMDEHFCQADWRHNLPVMMALLDVWNVNFLHIRARTLLPYDGRLRYLPSYIEQLEMESNGKSVGVDGELLTYSTCPVIWGEVGPNAQHAFYQLLHQGSQPVACDFIVPARRYHLDGRQDVELQRQHRLALANSLAQSRLLAFGDAALDTPASEPWRRYRGNQPSNLLLLDELNPFTLGALIALYEHKVFVSSVIWHINAFDQWGVEMGKVIANELLPLIDGEVVTKEGGAAQRLDSSTLGLLRHL